MKQLLLCLFFIVLFGEFSFSQFPNGFSFTEKVVFPGQQKSIYLTHFFSTCIQPEYHYPKEILDSIGDFLKNNPEISIEIAFHTDQRGSEKANQTLSQRRAELFKEEICRKGNVDNRRIIAKGYGESQPIVGLDSISKVSREEKESLYQQNRRTVITILKNELPPLDLSSQNVIVGQTLTLQNLATDFRGSILKESQPFMDSLIHFMENNETVIIQVINHIDQRGAAKPIKQLSENRAKAFKNYLIWNSQINSKRIITDGYGLEKPIITLDSISKVNQNEKELLFAINRRYELTIISDTFKCEKYCLNNIYGYDTGFVYLERKYTIDGDFNGYDSSYTLVKRGLNGLVINHSPRDSTIITEISYSSNKFYFNQNYLFTKNSFVFQCDSCRFGSREEIQQGELFRKIFIDSILIEILYEKDYSIKEIMIKENYQPVLYWIPKPNEKFAKPSFE